MAINVIIIFVEILLVHAFDNVAQWSKGRVPTALGCEVVQSGRKKEISIGNISYLTTFLTHQQLPTL